MARVFPTGSGSQRKIRPREDQKAHYNQSVEPQYAGQSGREDGRTGADDNAGVHMAYMDSLHRLEIRTYRNLNIFYKFSN